MATSTGDGRAGGRAVTDDGLLDVTLAIPRSMGGPGGATNPEQLFAADWASCFHSAVKAVAAQQKVEVSNSAVVVEVAVHAKPEGGFTLSTALHVEFGGLNPTTADQLAQGAHAVCPRSNATRGNIAVTVDAIVG